MQARQTDALPGCTEQRPQVLGLARAPFSVTATRVAIAGLPVAIGSVGQ